VLKNRFDKIGVSPFQVGDHVMAASVFLSDSKSEVQLQKGVQGIVHKVDSYGDIVIDFPEKRRQ